MKKNLSLLFGFMLSFCSAQQTPEFKEVIRFYDYQRSMLNKEFQKRYDSERSPENKLAVKKDFDEFMMKLDSIQNNAFIHTLVRVKIREDLERLRISEDGSAANPAKSELTRDARYSDGFEIMRQQIGSLFYTQAIRPDQKLLRTKLIFVVEKDGSLSSVRAEGDNFTFNRQAEIALYLLPGTFSPAYIRGTPIRYRFSLPLALNFE